MANKRNEVKMAATGRIFQVGNLYDYPNDNIIPDEQLSEDDQAELVYNDCRNLPLELSCEDLDSVNNKWELMGLDEHLQASTMAGLISKYRGASNYLNDKINPSQVSRILVLRAKCREERLDADEFIKEDVPRLVVETKATHVAVGVTYGTEAYCVLTQDLDAKFDDEEAREEARDEAKKNLSNWGSKLLDALVEQQKLADFQREFNEEERQSVTKIKCRLYADLQIQAVKECSIVDAYKHCMKLIEEAQKTDEESKAVPISVSLYPLKMMLKPTKEFVQKLQYRDIDGDVVSRCCNIFCEFERVIGEADLMRATNKNIRASLRPFIEAVDSFQVLLKKELKTAVLKSRKNEDDGELTKIVDAVLKHSIFKPKRLDSWLNYKKAESEILEKIHKTKGITVFGSQTLLANELTETDKKYALVLCVASVDQRTKDILSKMKDSVKSDKILVGNVQEEDTDEEEVEDGKDFPWHMDARKRKQVMEKIRELANYAEKNKHLENQVQFLMVIGDVGKRLFRYSVYENDNVLKENIELPSPPNGLSIKAKTPTSVHVEWDNKELGYPFHYLVEHRLKDSSDPWKQQKIKASEHRMAINMRDGAAMEIRMAMDTCIGRGEFSDAIDTDSELTTDDTEANLCAKLEKSKSNYNTREKGESKKPTGLITNFKGINRNDCIKMAALGRLFELGNLYDYRRDKFTDDWIELEFEIEFEEHNEIQLSIADPESLKNKWDFLGLGDHLKASITSGLIDKFTGASNYLNDKMSSSQVSRVLILRAVTAKQRLTLLNPIDCELVIANATKSTHAVVGATYGLKAYCVIYQDFVNGNRTREEAEEHIADLVGRLKEALNKMLDWGDFNAEERPSLTRVKCRIYADNQIQAVRECSVIDAYNHCMKLIEKIRNSNEVRKIQSVPLSISLCPLKQMVGKVKDAAKLLKYRDVDSGLVSRCCHIFMELERISGEATALRATINRNSRTPLREFVETIEKFETLLKKDLKVAVVKARESDDDEEQVANIIEVAERHPLFKPSRLERWLKYKKSESDMLEKLNKTKGIAILSSKKELADKLGTSFDQKYTLVLWVPPLDGNTNEILEAMVNYVRNYTKLVTGSQDSQEVQDKKPWHMDPLLRIQIEEKIRKFNDYAVKNQSAQVQFFVAFDECNGKISCRYSVYEAENKLKDDFGKLPVPPTNLRIQPTPAEKARRVKKSQSIWVLWDYEDLGYPHHFVVEYRVKDGDNEPWKQQKTSKQGETQLTVNIPAGEVVEVRVAADTCIGRSEFSETADTESLEIDDCGSGQYEDADNSSQSSGHEKNLQGRPPRYSRELSTNTGHRHLQRDSSFTSSPSVHFDYSGHARKETPTRLTRQESLNRSMKTEQVGSNIYQEPTSTRTGQETFVQRQSSFPSNYATRFDSPKPYSNPRSPMDQPSSVAFTPGPKVRVKADPAGQTSNNLSSGYQTFHCQEQLPPQAPPTPAPRTRPILNQRIKTASQLQGRKIRFAEAITSHCNKIGIRNGLDLYSVPLTKSSEIGSILGSIAERFSFGEADGKMLRKTILVMGATGSGKTTLINAMINYIFDVQWTDNFRFQLINEGMVDQSEAHSQTSKITAYDIYYQEGFRVPYSLTIVDTPGYGDTKGVERDKEITEIIRTFFEDKTGIQELNVVGFVASASTPRLTPTQMYIFDSVLSIFGKDVKDNIDFLLTHADSQVSPVLSAIIEADLSCSKDTTGKPLHHKFNNSGFFCSNREIDNTADKFNRFFWRLGMENFEKFFLVLNKMKSKSLSLTKEVLEERKQLEATIDGLQPLIKIGLAKMDEIRKIKEMIADNKTQMEKNKIVQFEFDETVARKADIHVGMFVTNCKECNVTCHYPCTSEEDEDKFECSAMDKSMPEATRRCTVCPGKCLWTFHASQPFRWEHVQVKQMTTSDAIKTTYESKGNTQMTPEDLIQALQQTIEENEEAMAEKVNTVTKCIARLEEIALRPTPFSSAQYIDLIIDAEQQEQRPGFEERIISLERLRSMAEIQERIRNGDPPF